MLAYRHTQGYQLCWVHASHKINHYPSNYGSQNKKVRTFVLFVGFLVVVLWLPCRFLLAKIIFEFVACLICMLSLVDPHRDRLL